MMKKSYNFSVKTRYVNSKAEDKVEIEFTEEEYNDEEKREKIIQEYFDDWLWQNIEINWYEVNC